jgi:hypothetical protein
MRYKICGTELIGHENIIRALIRYCVYRVFAQFFSKQLGEGVSDYERGRQPRKRFGDNI